MRCEFRISDSVKFVDVRFRGQSVFRGFIFGYSIGKTFEGIAGKTVDGMRFSWGFRIPWGLKVVVPMFSVSSMSIVEGKLPFFRTMHGCHAVYVCVM